MGLFEPAVDDVDCVGPDAKAVELRARDPAGFRRIIPSDRRRILVQRDHQVLVDRIRQSLARDDHDAERGYDPRPQRGLLANLTNDRRLERLPRLYVAAGQRPRSDRRWATTAHDQDAPCTADDHGTHGDDRGRLGLRFMGHAMILRPMLGLGLVRPLEDDWRGTLDAVARRRHWPTSHDVAKLAARVAGLSAAYNDPTVARAGVAEAGAARLGFAFARDVPKGAAAVRELVATGMFPLDGEPLRILDVGAGLGATTWGVVRALQAAGSRRVVEATWVDQDAQALELATEVVRQRAGRGGNSLRVTTLVRSVSTVGALDDLARFDIVLVGHVLSELEIGVAAETRVDRHADLIGAWLGRRATDHGALVVVEPALRDRTRHLHHVRNVLAGRGATVFAPCMHAGPCPALARESDWCHEDLPVDLPRWLAPIAHAAALRREGLTFSYLVLRKDGARLADALPAPSGAARLRVVSELMRTKGKRDAFVCGELAASEGGALVPVRVRTTRLDRDKCDGNGAWADLMRGDDVVVDPAPTLQQPRIGRDAKVSRS
jgi:hypothetical protein